MSRLATRFVSRLGRAISRWGLLAAFMLCLTAAQAQICASPGNDGALVVSTVGRDINTYYPGYGAGTTAIGFSYISYDSAAGRGGSAIVAGDLVMLMQMQDGSAVSSNDVDYGAPAAVAGYYEFARVVTAVANTLTIDRYLKKTYVQNPAKNQTYQVIRVPQYSSVTVEPGASLVPQPWDGNTGGVLVFDVAGALVNNGQIDASFAGFRGNAGRHLRGKSGAVAMTEANYDRVQPDDYPAHGGKGEGTGGTPDRVLKVFSTPGMRIVSDGTSANAGTANATTTNTSIATLGATYLVTTGRSYEGGSRAAGAFANAGGGGDDGAPANNSENAGGGGGGGGGAGGVGGNSWRSNQPIGGRGGAATAAGFGGRLVLGGGGGSGSANNGYELDASGGAGGGLIFVRAGAVSGRGLWAASGQGGRSIPLKNNGIDCPASSSNSCDAAGGGGGGGGIVVLADSGSIYNARALGGNGGRVNGLDHGPGGGGGGGYVLSNIPSLSYVTRGAAGVINAGTAGAANTYGAGDGADGVTGPANSTKRSADCMPKLTVSKLTSTPAASVTIVPPGTTTYSIVLENAADQAEARGITLYEPLLPGGTATFSNPPTPTLTFRTKPFVCTLSGRSAAVDPAAGGRAALHIGTFKLPGGCGMTYTFSVSLPAALPGGIYNNSALAWFHDPSVSNNRTVTAALPPAAAGLAANTAYATGAVVGGDNYNGDRSANTAEDIRIQGFANLQLSKSNGVSMLPAGGQTTYTLVVSNLGPSDGSGTLLRDPVSDGLSCSDVVCSRASGAAVCPAPSGVTIAALQGTGIGLSSLPASSSLTFTVSCGVTATGL